MEMYKNLHSDDEKHEDSPKSIRTLAFEIMCRDEPPSDSFLLLLPPTVPGFGMHDKKWRILQVEHISAIEWNKNAFEQLVLDYNHRELIEAVIRGHMSSNMSPDIVEGKGKGVIILLHGGPGTGKTLTAESVAELAEKPLYRVTCGDIGTDPEKVEKYLESVLFIGSAWQAVVLLDESDVFLEEREKMDLKRNALVSVFLRVLEYYEGILILTSNRGM
uniref:AAA family ATPase n=1 Tax=Colletotrichum fructicola (strain Nara gc5) TaxID=1213859 RepID=L2G1I5_COLFN